ncbi:MAG: cyclic nucleotide-binding domain-containing protein [Gaiellaceae bacterium]
MEATRLAAIPLFAGLAGAELEALAWATSEVTAAAGDVVVTEGDFGHALYAIESGTAEARRDGTSLRDLGPGDVFGEIAVVAAGRRTASVVATSPLRLLAIFKRDVWALERHSPEAAERLRSLIAGRRDTDPPSL